MHCQKLSVSRYAVAKTKTKAKNIYISFHGRYVRWSDLGLIWSISYKWRTGPNNRFDFTYYIHTLKNIKWIGYNNFLKLERPRWSNMRTKLDVLFWLKLDVLFWLKVSTFIHSFLHSFRYLKICCPFPASAIWPVRDIYYKTKT